MKKINVKETILSEIKNVELVSVKNFGCKNGYDMNGDVTIEFDIHGRHCGCTKEDFDFGGLFLGGWTEDEGWAEEKAEELGITTDELYNKYDYFDFADEYNEYCAKVIEDEWYDIFGYDDEEDNELMEIAKEYIEDNIDKIYRLEDADYSLNFEADMSKLFVFGEFVGYVITEDFDYEYDAELYDKIYRNVGKIYNEDEDKIEFEMINKKFDFCIQLWDQTKYVNFNDGITDEDIYDIKIEDGNIYAADYIDEIAA